MQRQKSFAYSLKLCVCKPFSFHDGTMKMIVDIGKGTKLQLCCTNPRIGNRRFSLKFCTVRDVYGHFHISTQINDYIGPSGREKCSQQTVFKECARLFWLRISRNNSKDQRRPKQHAPQGTWYTVGQSQHSF